MKTLIEEQEVISSSPMRANLRARSQRAFATYAFALGIVVMVCPHHLCRIITTATGGFLSEKEILPDQLAGQYGAIVGFFYFYLGCMYFGLAESAEFARYSVFGRRVIVPLAQLALIAAGKYHPKLFVFAMVDVAFACWTATLL